MKYIFLIVLLANISFFLWEYNSPHLYSAQAPKTQNRQKLKPILLLSEGVISTENNKNHPDLQLKSTQSKQLIASKGNNKKEDTVQGLLSPVRQETNIVNKLESETKALIEKTAIAAQQKPLLPAIEEICYEVGPFYDENQLDQWLVLNKNSYRHFQRIKKNSPVNPRYLVYSPATGDIEQSKKNITFFQKLGVNELWMFRKGELEGAISFGLFSKEDRALFLQNKLSKKGLETKILHTEKSKSTLYLQIFTEKERLKSVFNINNKPVITECKSV